MPAVDPCRFSGDALLEAVTDAVVALHLRYYHRVPARARTRLMNEDLLVCTLSGVYTDVEKTLIELGQQVVVKETRQDFQRAVQQRYIDVVEGLSGRSVVSFVSQQHVGPDTALELFLLAPLEGSGANDV